MLLSKVSYTLPIATRSRIIGGPHFCSNLMSWSFLFHSNGLRGFIKSSSVEANWVGLIAAMSPVTVDGRTGWQHLNCSPSLLSVSTRTTRALEQLKSLISACFFNPLNNSRSVAASKSSWSRTCCRLRICAPFLSPINCSKAQAFHGLKT